MTLRSLKTGEIIARKQIAGSPPEQCFVIESFTIGQYQKRKVGDAPTLDALEAWLKSFVE
jgi:hypothetical protein